MSYSYSIVEEPQSWIVYQHDSSYRYHLCLCPTKEIAERICNALVAHEGGEGSWYYDARNCRSASRGGDTPDYRSGM